MNPDRWGEWAGNTGWKPAVRGSERSPLTGLLGALRRRYYNYFTPNGAGMERTGGRVAEIKSAEIEAGWQGIQSFICSGFDVAAPEDGRAPES